MSEHHGSPRVEGHHVQVRLHKVGYREIKNREKTTFIVVIV